VIIRPFGLRSSPAVVEGGIQSGIETSQGRTGASRRSIPRDEVAAICAEALRLPHGQQKTFECWATNEHRRRVEWDSIAPDPAGGVPDVNHDFATAAGLGTAALLGGGAVRAVALASRRLLRVLRK